MFLALKVYIKGGVLDWTLFRQEQGISQDIRENYLSKEEETRCF